MKLRLLILSFSVIFSMSCSAQSFFKPLPKLSSVSAGKFGISLDSIVKSIRPVVVISGTVSNGASLAGGAGIGYQSNKWDPASQAYITQYSISLIGLLGTNGNQITGTAGLVIGIPGTNGMLAVGGGRDFTQKAWVFIPTIQIKFN
jgi:hypothetical protein